MATVVSFASASKERIPGGSARCAASGAGSSLLGAWETRGGVAGVDWAVGKDVAGFFTCAGVAGASWARTASSETQKPANVTANSRQQVSFINEGDFSQTGVFDEAEE